MPPTWRLRGSLSRLGTAVLDALTTLPRFSVERKLKQGLMLWVSFK